MYCTICKTQYQPDEHFCRCCGNELSSQSTYATVTQRSSSSVGTGANQQQPSQLSVGPGSADAPAPANCCVPTETPPLAKRLFALFAAVLLTAGLVMSVLKPLQLSWSTSVMGLTQSGASAESMSQLGVSWAMLLIVVLDIAGIVGLLLYTFGTIHTPDICILAATLSVLALIVFVLAWIIKGGELSHDIDERVFLVSDYQGDYDDQISVSFGPANMGWILMFCQAGAIALALIQAKQDAKLSRS